MKKSVYALFFVLLLTFINCSGFAYKTDENFKQTNAFRICRQVGDNGKIAITYVFPVNSEPLTKLNFSEEEIKTYRFYLASYVNALQTQNQNKSLDGVKITPVAYYEDVDGIGFSIIFDSLEIQKEFFGADSEEDSETKNDIKTSGFFVRKTKLSTSFVFPTKSAAENVKQICILAVNSWCNNHNIENKQDIIKIFDESVFIYDYMSLDGKLKSQNFYKDENFYHNVFIKTLNDIENDNTITFYFSTPNVSVWYISAIVLVVIGMIISYFYCAKQKK